MTVRHLGNPGSAAQQQARKHARAQKRSWSTYYVLAILAAICGLLIYATI